MRLFAMVLLTQMLFSDPFYYGDMEFRRGLKLFGILHTKANINGEWVEINASFAHANESFKLLALQGSCVILENMESKKKQKLCKDKPKFIKERGKAK